MRSAAAGGYEETKEQEVGGRRQEPYDLFAVALQCFMSLDAKKVLMLDVKQWQAALCPRNSRRLYLTWQPAGGELGKSWEDLPHPSADVSPYGLLDFPLGRGLFELTLRSEEERGDWYLLLLSRSECARASYLA